jgi:hypothetical protein
MTFDGVFHFESPIAGEIRGAVFLGKGMFSAKPPDVEYERQHLERMLSADTVESTFQTAALRFTDETFGEIGAEPLREASPPSEAVDLAADFNSHLLKETGLNVAARLLVSILNREVPGVFIAELDKGKLGRFCFIFDCQGRLLTQTFGLNGGEKGLIFSHNRRFGNDVWMAFYANDDYVQGRVSYTDMFDLVQISHYEMKVDVRQPNKTLGLTATMTMEVLAEGAQAIPFELNDSLSEYESERQKKALRVKKAQFADGDPVSAIQEEWEAGFTLLLPLTLTVGDRLSLSVQLEGDFMQEGWSLKNYHYPRRTGQWYPRHGYLQRSTFDLTFHHRDRDRVAAVGVRTREEASENGKSEMTTQWKAESQLIMATFGVGPFERHEERLEQGLLDVPVEFYSLPGKIRAIKEDFVLTELKNCLGYFSSVFGQYPYGKFGAMYHPWGFGQGFPTLLLLPKADRSSKYTYAFVAHETAHQWWGNIVSWRSYRDQWLSEGFAEYSGILYTGLRDKPSSAEDLLEDLRKSLRNPPLTDTGVGKGRLTDIGPIILGHRLNTRETIGAYQTLIYNKGALILRMLHFLMTQVNTGDGKLFFEMLSEFVQQHENSCATTESFLQTASQYFSRSDVARKYKLKDLNWFFRQWVYGTALPTYRLEYKFEKGQGEGGTLRGTLYQEETPDDWFMVLPLVLEFSDKQVARGTIHVFGPETAVEIPLPQGPKEVFLDPEMWVLSAKTSTKSFR